MSSLYSSSIITSCSLAFGMITVSRPVLAAASITVATAVISALENVPVEQNIAMTGSLSVRGDVLPVGGVTHKIEAAAKTGLDTVIIPKANEQDVMIEDEYKEDI